MQAQSMAIYSRIKSGGILAEIPLLITFNLLLVGSAYLSINVPFSPVPITGQTFGVLLIAMALGRTRATALLLAYLAEGAMGLPVFAGGAAGPQVLIGPTAGYLYGFVMAAGLVGYLADKGWDRSYLSSTIAMTIGTTLIFVSGLAWLNAFVPNGTLMAVGLVPFLPGAIVKIGLAAIILPTIWKKILPNK